MNWDTAESHGRCPPESSSGEDEYAGYPFFPERNACRHALRRANRKWRNDDGERAGDFLGQAVMPREPLRPHSAQNAQRNVKALAQAFREIPQTRGRSEA